MQINLRLLDKQPSFGYNQIIPVFLGDRNNHVGECEIIRGDKGQHLGVLGLQKEIPPHFYMYYISSVTEDPVFYLTELLFLEEPLKGKHTTQLGDNLVL